MSTIADEIVLAEKIKAILRDFNPDADEPQVQDALDALIALLRDSDEEE
jgi:hypothetical protein